MKEPSPPLAIGPIDRRIPLSQQIYDRLRHAIDAHLLRPGARLASARALASELGVARGTVESAYQRLAGEGYLLARGPAGTIVSPHLARQPAPQPAKATTNARPRSDRGAMAVNPEPPLPFQLGIPGLDAFPRKLWSRLATRRIRTTSPPELSYSDPRGYLPLRQAIAAYLLVSRGVPCRAEQVLVTGGYRASLALIVQTLLRQRDRVWIENPCYPPTRTLLERAGTIPCAVPVDDEGLVVAQGIRQAPKARLAVVTPSHQAPLGVSMSMPRRLQLLDWASRHEAWIVEDDYDGEFHYHGPPLPALKSRDTTDRVIYAGSFSKVLFPGLSLGYLVLPERLTEQFSASVQIWPNYVARVTQAVVADFIDNGHFSRHLKKMRALYAHRRALLAAALTDAFGARVTIDLARGGMHLVARFAGRTSDETLARRAQRAGLNCQALSPRYLGETKREGLLMGFTNVATAQEAARLAAALRDALALGNVSA
jgi:GntR family transcriptional regulator / MocR family aminotransferase